MMKMGMSRTWTNHRREEGEMAGRVENAFNVAGLL